MKEPGRIGQVFSLWRYRWEPRRQCLRSQIPPSDLPFTQKSARTWADFAWRYRWDLNPRCACTHTTFRELHLRPLGHDTEIKITSYLMPTEIVQLSMVLKKLAQDCTALIR